MGRSILSCMCDVNLVIQFMYITGQREAGSEYRSMRWACTQWGEQHGNDSKPFTFNIIWQVGPLHHIIHINKLWWRDCVLSGLRRKRAKQLHLVTMVTILSMNKRERKRAKRASLPRNQVYLKVIYLSEWFAHTSLLSILFHVENVILSVFISFRA